MLNVLGIESNKTQLEGSETSLNTGSETSGFGEAFSQAVDETSAQSSTFSEKPPQVERTSEQPDIPVEFQTEQNFTAVFSENGFRLSSQDTRALLTVEPTKEIVPAIIPDIALEVDDLESLDAVDSDSIGTSVFSSPLGMIKNTLKDVDSVNSTVKPELKSFSLNDKSPFQFSGKSDLASGNDSNILKDAGIDTAKIQTSASPSSLFETQLKRGMTNSTKMETAFESLSKPVNGAAVDTTSATNITSQSNATSPLNHVEQLQAASSARFNINVQFGRMDWNNAVMDQVAKMAAQNLNFAEIQLDPPELGSLQVRVQVNQDQAAIVFNSANAQVKDALEQSASRLREMFNAEGFNFVDVDVRDQGQQQQDSDSSPLFSRSSDQEDQDVTTVDSELSVTLESGVDHYV